MDQFTQAVPVWLEAVLALWLGLGIAVYSGVGRKLFRGGGNVSTKEFGLPEVFLGCAFMGWMLLAIATSFGQQGKDLSSHDIIQSAVAYCEIIAFIFIFLAIRKIPPFLQFGFMRRNPLQCLGIALGLIFCAEPMLVAVETLTADAMHGHTQAQSVVEFFLKASERSDRKAIWAMIVVAGVLAPIAEETIFRGLIYGVLKRHAGGIAAGIVSAGLFAAMHMNLSALPALFVLALCLTAAYEVTGSLLTNIFMHGIFNLTMLLLMLHLPPPGTS